MEQADRRPSTDRRVGAGPRVGHRHDAGGDGTIGVGVAAVAILDLGHHGDVGDRLTVEPVRRQRIARHDARPDIEMAGGAQRRVSRAGDDADAPRPVVRRQKQQRDRFVVLQRGTERGRHRAVGRAEVAPVVDEATVVELLIWATGTERRQPRRQLRPAAACVHHEVRPQLFAGVGDDPGHVRHSVRSIRKQSAHGDTAHDLDVRFGRHQPGDDGLDDRSTPGQHREPLVARPRPAGDLVRGGAHDVVAQGAVHFQRRRQVGQLGLHDLTEPGQEVVEHVELIDPATPPRIPRLLGRRRRVRVAFEQADLMTVTGEHHRAAQSSDPASDHDHVGHLSLPPSRPVVPF